MLAADERAFGDLGVDVEWIDFPGGTGAIMAALESGTIDVATPLTEGAVTAIVNGNPSRLARIFVESPLLWGVHVAADFPAESLEDLEGNRFAISRFGSGSELMSRVLAEDRGWLLDDASWVEVGDVDGALEALSGGDAEIFLWNKSMTQPHVDRGVLRRVDVVPTPWPSFTVAVSEPTRRFTPGLAEAIADVAAARAAGVVFDPGSPALIAERFGLNADDAVAFLDQIEWAEAGQPIDTTMIESVMTRMHALGRIDTLVDPRSLLT